MKRHYLVSFGDSNTYSVTTRSDAEAVRNCLVNSLSAKFPMGHVSRSVMLDIHAVDAEAAKGYPALTEATLDTVKEALCREMQVEAATALLNDGDPYDLKTGS